MIFLGIDIGTTVLKAATFDAASERIIAGESQRLNIEVGQDGRREQNSAELIRALGSLIRRLRSKTRGRWSTLAGIGLAAQGGSAVVVDRATGAAHSPLFLWNDMRAQPYLGQLTSLRPIEYWRQLSWRDQPGWGLARMLWLRENKSDPLRDGRLYAGVGEFVFFHLTGEWRQDAGNALQIGCYNVPQRRLDAEPLALVGVAPDAVAPVRQDHHPRPISSRAAKLLGLPAETPVFGPYMDHEAAYLAVGAQERRVVHLSLGTAWVANFVLPEAARWHSPFQLVLPSPQSEGWLVVQPMLTGNVTWDWCLRTLLHTDLRRALTQAQGIFDERVAPTAGLVCLPWFNMPNTLCPGALGAGAFHGLGASSTREDLVRAVAAGMVCETVRVLAEISQSGRFDEVVLSGGATKADYVQKLFSAALSPLPVRVLDDEDWAGARGTAAAVCPRVVRVRSRRAAKPSPALLRRAPEMLAEYQQVFDRLYGHVPAGGALRFLKEAVS